MTEEVRRYFEKKTRKSSEMLKEGAKDIRPKTRFKAIHIERILKKERND